MRKADSSLHGRPVRKSADREAKHPAIPLGMTAQAHRRPKQKLAQAAVAGFYKDSARRAAAWLLLAGIRFYQAVFAPVMPVGCKFYPSCSHYAAEAIERHGAARGVWLAAARLWRCRPFTKGGFDPVPDAVADMSERFGHGLGNVASNRARNEVGS
jgi:putative membrane protein insertion efficiency factor